MIMSGYPEHDMNKLFDIIDEGVKSFWVDEEAVDEASFLNRLFATLPAQAVEYGMLYIHGKKDLPSEAKEILPLYERLSSLITYLEEAELLNQPMTDTSTSELTKRQNASEDMDKRRKDFLKPLFGFKYKTETKQAVKEGEETKEGSGMHLMNASASVFVCPNPLRTASFYENHAGFSASHLDDEAMPHILLSRDNIHIVLVSGKFVPLREFTNIPYDMYIYVSEPMLLQNELSNNGVNIISELISAEESDKKCINREFVFEDCDGRHICVSQKNI